MDNKALGAILIGIGIVLVIIILMFNAQLRDHAEAGCACTAGGNSCPHEQGTPWQTFLGIGLISAMAALGLYLIFFEKSQRAIVSTLENQRQVRKGEEEFEILLKGLDKTEQKVLKSVREQDGITQSTLRLRTGLHKTKLSIVLEKLEKKGLIAREAKGKTKAVYFRI